jgi:hypothetical protein
LDPSRSLMAAGPRPLLHQVLILGPDEATSSLRQPSGLRIENLLMLTCLTIIDWHERVGRDSSRSNVHDNNARSVKEVEEGSSSSHCAVDVEQKPSRKETGVALSSRSRVRDEYA